MSDHDHLSEKGKRDFILIQDALRGDQKAYAQLMSFYRNQLYFTMYRMVKNAEDAEDLTMDAFGKAFNQLHQYVPKFAFSTWLFKIASNNCIDFMRKKHKNLIQEEHASLLHAHSDTLNPEQHAVEKQKISYLHLVVENLKPTYRQLIQKRYFEELSYEEIAQELDLPLGTVKARLFRARDFLATILHKTKDSI